MDASIASSLRAPSVVMATFNGERFVGEQLHSLFRQTVAPAEIIVCDDGSTDATMDIVQSLAKQSPAPLRVRRNPARLGFADNFLSGCQSASSDLIAFCDQDDVWLENKLALCAGPDGVVN